MPKKDLHRIRLTVDVIYEGPKLSPSASALVANNLATHAHVLAFEDIKNVEVVFKPAPERVAYAHHHESEDGGYCRVSGGCLEQAQDALDQNNL